LKEFLEVMQPASKLKTWDTQVMDDPAGEPPMKIQAMELPEVESDGEYEAVPKKSEMKSLPTPPLSAGPISTTSLHRVSVQEETLQPDQENPEATDDDWLRGRTNRLLDIMDPADIPVAQFEAGRKAVTPQDETALGASEPQILEQKPEVAEDWGGFEDEKPDPVIEAIKSNGRLFVRNLPYTATEEELREHFASYGLLEEVKNPTLVLSSYFIVMNIQIGTTYAFVCMM
jgi:multiple RNA-binding domain-containing protein 1